MKKLRLGTLAFLAIGTATIAQAASDVGPYYWIFKRADYHPNFNGQSGSGGCAIPFYLGGDSSTKRLVYGHDRV